MFIGPRIRGFRLDFKSTIVPTFLIIVTSNITMQLNLMHIWVILELELIVVDLVLIPMGLTATPRAHSKGKLVVLKK